MGWNTSSAAAEIVDFKHVVAEDIDLPVLESSGDFYSKDTLQSLVQSCVCGDHHLQQTSQHNTTECHHHFFEQDKFVSNKSNKRAHCSTLSFTLQDKNNSCARFHHINEIVSCPCDGAFEKAEAAEKAKKARISWTEDLHKKFLQSIDHLGGSRKATPKGILKLMNCEKLTIFQVKSHLQKYRSDQIMPQRVLEPADSTFKGSQMDAQTGVKIVEALRLQLQVQRDLYEQLEEQKQLQIRIEEQANELRTLIHTQSIKHY